jgi:hypothetical protein
MRWEVCSEATVGPTVPSYAARSFSGPSPWRADANGKEDPRKAGLTYQYAGLHYNQDYNDSDVVWRDTVEEAIEDEQAIYGVVSTGTPKLVGWSKGFTGMGGDSATSPFESVTGFEDRYVLGLVFTRYDAPVVDEIEVFEAGGATTQCSFYAAPLFAGRVVGNKTGPLLNRNVTVQQASVAPAGAEVSWACYNGGSYAGSGVDLFYAYIIACKPVLTCDEVAPDSAIEVPDAPGFYIEDGEIVDYGKSCEVVTGTFKQLSTLTHGLDGGSLGTAKILTYPLGPVVSSADSSYSDKDFWDAQYALQVSAGYMAAGMTYSSTGTGTSSTYPRITSSACVCTPSIQIVTPGMVYLPDIVADLAGRTGVDVSQLDLTALFGIPVRGYPIARETTADAAILELMRVFFFELPEWGNSGDVGTKLRAVTRGGPSILALTEDDIIEVNGDEFSRPQQLEFPRKLSLTGADPDANYEPATEAAERESENVKAVGEERASTVVVMSRDELAIAADKMLKIATAESTGRITRTVPMKFSGYTPSDRLVYNSKRYRIEQATLSENGIEWEMVADRASAAISTATGGTPQTPTTPPSTVRGPTVFAAMNISSLRSADNVPGMYLAAQGMLSGWTGADIYLSVDGGLTEQRVTSITQAATMGKLTADCTDSSEPISVKLYQGGELDSITTEQLAARMNGFAVTTDGVTEVGQFQDADETAELQYDLTNISRGQAGSEADAHFTGDMFVLLDTSIVFLPLDVSLAGKTLIFRAVTLGTPNASNATTTVVFDPPTFIRSGGEVIP